MIEASALRKGSKFVFRDEPYEVIEFQKFMMGRGRGNIRIKMKHMKNGRVLENTFSTDERFEYVDLRTSEMQYLYFDGSGFVFMDQTTYDQISFNEDTIGDFKWFLKEGETYKIMLIDEEPVSMDLPAAYTLQIVDTEPAVKGDSVTNIFKDAVTETGLKIKVPLFIKENEYIYVDTRTLDYLKRSNE